MEVGGRPSRVGEMLGRQVDADPRVVLRTRGRMYDRRATRITDPGTIDALFGLVSEKYNAGRGDPETTWFFRLDPPRS